MEGSHDHFGNIGMTLTHPQEYYDIDEVSEDRQGDTVSSRMPRSTISLKSAAAMPASTGTRNGIMQQVETGIEQTVSDAEVIAT